MKKFKLSEVHNAVVSIFVLEGAKDDKNSFKVEQWENHNFTLYHAELEPEGVTDGKEGAEVTWALSDWVEVGAGLSNEPAQDILRKYLEAQEK